MIVAVAVALLVVACGSAASGHGEPTGKLTGYLVFAGGPGPNVDKNGHEVWRKVAGTVTVFDRHGKKITDMVVRAGQPFHFTLPAGHYKLNQGDKVYVPRNCRPVSVTVRPSTTTKVNVGTGCGIP